MTSRQPTASAANGTGSTAGEATGGEARGSEATTGVRLDFAHAGNAEKFMVSGWSRPEPQHTWSVGAESMLVIPAPRLRRRATLTLDGWPHLRPGWIERQRIHVNVNGIDVGRVAMVGRQSVTVIVPRQALLGHDTLTITLRHPDAAAPADFPNGVPGEHRVLGVAYHGLSIEALDEDVAQLTGSIRRYFKMPVADRGLVAAPALSPAAARQHAAAFLHRFQSLGDDCEFGLFQRALGIEPLGLLRFSFIPLDEVVRGLECGFAGIGQADSFDIVEYDNAPGHDFMGRDRHYGMLYHTGRHPGDIDAVTLKAQEMQRLRFLARKIMEDAALPDQIFVVKRKQRPIAAEIARLLLALQERGESRLLWVREAGDGIPPGTAERVTQRLVAAYVDRIDVSPMQNISVDSWAAACRAAWMLLQQGERTDAP